MRLLHAAVAASLCLCEQASGQAVRGLILSDKGPPINGASVSLLDSAAKVVASVRTDSLGAYRISGAPAGRYRLVARRIGFDSTSRVVVLQPRETSRVELTLRTSVWALETVQIKDRPLLKVTPGREFFRRHQELGKGLFVDGRDIVRSKMSVSVFLGKLDGMVLTGSIITPDPWAPTLISPPIIPAGEGQYLTSALRNQCLIGRIDRFSIVGLLIQYGAETIDDLLEAEDVVAAEVYRDFNEVPAEWRGDAVVNRIVFRPPPGNYFMGDAGMPHCTMGKIGYQPGKLLTAPAPGSGVLRPAVTVEHRLTLMEKQKAYEDIKRQDPPWAETWYDASPLCGFLQIWTNIAW